MIYCEFFTEQSESERGRMFRCFGVERAQVNPDHLARPYLAWAQARPHPLKLLINEHGNVGQVGRWLRPVVHEITENANARRRGHR